MESLKKNLILKWLRWHFLENTRKLALGLSNLIFFNFHFFGTFYHLKTLFSHWRQYRESYGRGFDIKRYTMAFLFNMISRGMGALIRTIVIIFSLVSGILISLLAGIFLIIWLALPLLEILAIFYSLKLWI